MPAPCGAQLPAPSCLCKEQLAHDGSDEDWWQHTCRLILCLRMHFGAGRCCKASLRRVRSPSANRAAVFSGAANQQRRETMLQGCPQRASVHAGSAKPSHATRPCERSALALVSHHEHRQRSMISASAMWGGCCWLVSRAPCATRQKRVPERYTFGSRGPLKACRLASTGIHRGSSSRISEASASRVSSQRRFCALGVTADTLRCSIGSIAPPPAGHVADVDVDPFCSTLGQFRSTILARCGEVCADFGQHRSKLGRSRTSFGALRPNLAQTW